MFAAEVPPVFGVQAICLDDHGHRVPAHVRAQAPFELEVAGALGLVGRLDRVDVARVGRERPVHAVLACLFEQVVEQEVRAILALGIDHGSQRVEPLTGFLRVVVAGVGRTKARFGHCGHEGLLVLWTSRPTTGLRRARV
jgi:hypothetical protein